MAIDVERLSAEALTKHGIRLDPHDPAVVLVTLNRLVLEDTVECVAADIRKALRLAMEHLGTQSCIYAFGDDVIIGENATGGLIEVYERTGQPVLGAQEVAPHRKSSFGILECELRDGENHVTRVLEKPALADTDQISRRS